MREQELGLRDIKKMMSPINKRNKKIEIEKRNLEASLKIEAHNRLRQDNTRDEIGELRARVKNQIKADKLPLDAFTSVLDGRIKEMTYRVEQLEAQKESNGGVLKPGAENKLKEYNNTLDKLIKEKDDVVKDYERREQEEQEKLEKLENQRKLEEQERLKREEEAKKAEAIEKEHRDNLAKISTSPFNVNNIND